jgi:cytochrome P450
MMGSCARALQEITTHRARFPKPLEQYRLLTFFGGNIVSSEGEDWKRYRKIAAPAFSEVRPCPVPFEGEGAPTPQR